MPIKLSEALAQLLSDDNKDKSLGEIGEDLSDYLVQIKEMVEKGDITYSGLTEEISKYLDRKENPKPGSVSQLLLGCVDGDDWCPLNEKDNDVPFFYDEEKGKFLPVTDDLHPKNKDTYAILYMNGDPREVDLHSFKDIGEKGFRRVKIRHKDVSDSVYREMDITNLEKYIRKLTPIKTNSQDQLNTFMSVSFLILILFIIYYLTKRRGKN
jgi:hypothetical protein